MAQSRCSEAHQLSGNTIDPAALRALGIQNRQKPRRAVSEWLRRQYARCSYRALQILGLPFISPSRDIALAIIPERCRGLLAKETTRRQWQNLGHQALVITTESSSYDIFIFSKKDNGIQRYEPECSGAPSRVRSHDLFVIFGTLDRPEICLQSL